MAKYIIASTRLNDDGSVHSVSHPIEVDSDTINTIKIFDKTYILEKHGRWIDNKVAFHRVCSECGAVVRQDISLVYLLECMEKVGHLNYCPNCGAKIDEVEE